MAAQRLAYSDEERDRLRTALADHAVHFDLSPQQLADRIAETTEFAMSVDGGRKRVERFLKDTHRQTDDFIGAIADYLGSVPPPDIEQSAAMLAHFFARPVPRPVRIDELAGRYQVWISSDTPPKSDGGTSQVTVLDGYAFKPQPTVPMESRYAFAIIEMKPMPKTDALMVAESVINLAVDPEICTFPDDLPNVQDAGVIVAFGYSDRAVPRYLMTTRSVMETRLYHLYKADDDPLTLRGTLHFNGGIGRTAGLTHTDPLYPDCAVELVRISDDET